MAHFELHLKGRELPELAVRLRKLEGPECAERLALERAVRDECPLCGLCQNTVREMLKEPVESDNYQLALHVRDNCVECRKAIDLEGGRR